ncbi:hypothetical protein [Methylovirgula sp. 4M-Z18]|uniref:hypothetical protein n=1 Tax=Methylovirgula sp. 4M-Z18 TaxID=2293567 RepID=UPI001314FD2B|nr:hypothetical protein [Methylovirgula sp. 4M-Z18]
MQSKRRVFDCFLFNGEYDVLEIRLNELNDAVDTFVLVTADQTFSGLPQQSRFNPRDPRCAPFAAKIRHVWVHDFPQTEDAWTREAWQRNAVLRGVPDADAHDLIVMSDVDEIPRRSVIERIKADNENAIFGFELAFCYFFVDYCNVKGPESAITWAIAATRATLETRLPNDLRYEVRTRKVQAEIIQAAGWHFSYLMDDEAIVRKIKAFSHQELNTPEILNKIDVKAIVKQRRDLFDREGFVWDILPVGDLPQWVQENRGNLSYLFAPRFSIRAFWQGPRGGRSPSIAPAQKPPLVICPYLYDHEEQEIKDTFQLEGAARHIDFFLWQDVNRIGPEFAFEHCWNSFPDRDIIIMHSDMAPFPGDKVTDWYDTLVEHTRNLPDAGMVACNLFYPREENEPDWRLQCAGGILPNGNISVYRGYVQREVDPAKRFNDDGTAMIDQAMMARVRAVDWVTFGGVLIRRDTIRACGDFDRRYNWAYVMDVDYSYEARLRGFRLYQVPARLVHEESRTTKKLMDVDPSLKQKWISNIDIFKQKWLPFLPAMAEEMIQRE